MWLMILCKEKSRTFEVVCDAKYCESLGDFVVNVVQNVVKVHRNGPYLQHGEQPSLVSGNSHDISKAV